MDYKERGIEEEDKGRVIRGSKSRINSNCSCIASGRHLLLLILTNIVDNSRRL